MIWTTLILLPQTWILRVRKFCCMCFEDNEAVIKMIMKGKRARQWDMFPEPTEMLLIGCLIESIWTPWTPRTKSNTLTPRTNSQTYWPGETSHVMNGLIFFVLFNISHFSSTDCSEVMSKRTQEDTGGERVTAKSKPMTKLVSRCSERNLEVLASTALESPGENQTWKSITSGLVKCAAIKVRGDPLYTTLARRATQNGTLTRNLVFSRVEI